jgi:hypothetical protein
VRPLAALSGWRMGRLLRRGEVVSAPRLEVLQMDDVAMGANIMVFALLWGSFGGARLAEIR